MDTLSISSLGARDLPRTLLRSPSPSLEFHTLPASPPCKTLPAPPQNTTTPTWPDTLSYQLPSHDTSIGFVIRDTPYPHPPLASLTISPRRALTQGWFPLHSDRHTPAGELFFSLFAPSRCAAKPVSAVPHFPPIPLTKDRPSEKRSVSPEPGRLFRTGTLRLAITADGVPAAAKPIIKIAMVDQLVTGAEIHLPLEPSSEPSRVDGPPEPRSRSTAAAGSVLRARLRTGNRLEPAGKASLQAGKVLLKGASALRKHLTDDDNADAVHTERANPEPRVVQHGEPHVQTPDSSDGVQRQLDEEHAEEDVIDKAADAGDPIAETHPRSMRKFSFSKHGVKPRGQSKKPPPDVSERKRRRPVDFGSFELALVHGVTPAEISVQIQDSSSHLPEALTVLTDQKIQLPDLKALKCTCNRQCNTHLLTFQMSDRGDENAKIVLRITVECTMWEPIATDTSVTPRFRELMSTIDDMADTFKETFPNAENLTYLLVGGLFTKHYPAYFEKNIQFLQEKLRLPRVQTVPIHTEGSIARNAKIIRDSIVKTCRGSKSVVLIGHSKGGLDAVAVLDSFPETARFLYGIVTFQAPFGGTFLVDFVKRSKLAVSAISSVIESLWKGDQESLLDMSYSARAKSLQLSDLRIENSSERVENGLKAESEPEECSRVTVASTRDRSFDSTSKKKTQDMLDVYRQIPIVSVASYASFDVLGIRSAANAAGVASMSPAAQRIVKHTGFLCDGLVTAGDARIPHADTVLLDDMMHTEPALYVQGTRYPPGQLTASALVLLFEKMARQAQT